MRWEREGSDAADGVAGSAVVVVTRAGGLATELRTGDTTDKPDSNEEFAEIGAVKESGAADTELEAGAEEAGATVDRLAGVMETNDGDGNSSFSY